jgi:hypothetical protein
MTRNAKAELLIKNNIGNTFTGVLSIDNDIRDVFGWYTEKKNEGGLYSYNTRGIAFYVKLHAEYQHQQLFEGLFNYDNTIISGTYFYWGNEYPFFGSKFQTLNPPDDSLINEIIIDSLLLSENTEEQIDSSKRKFTISHIKNERNSNDIVIFPNPANDNITISSLIYDLQSYKVSIYTTHGQLVKIFQITSNPAILQLKDIKAGSYIMKIIDNQDTELDSYSIVLF